MVLRGPIPQLLLVTQHPRTPNSRHSIISIMLFGADGQGMHSPQPTQQRLGTDAHTELLTQVKDQPYERLSSVSEKSQGQTTGSQT